MTPCFYGLYAYTNMHLKKFTLDTHIKLSHFIFMFICLYFIYYLLFSTSELSPLLSVKVFFVCLKGYRMLYIVQMLQLFEKNVGFGAL